MRASPFIGPLEKEALEWDETLNRLQEVVDNWLACQATWQYLEPIFTSPDIMKQMPEEGDKFLQVRPLSFIASFIHAKLAIAEGVCLLQSKAPTYAALLLC